MSNLTVKGNASGTGTVILEAPNTNTNRTITLPDSTGTLATTADIPAAGGMTLLGTLATTSGTSVTLSGLTLTDYKSLFVTYSGIIFAGADTLTFGTLAVGTVFSGTSQGWGAFWVDLTSGACGGGHARIVSSAGVQAVGGSSGVTTASTSVTFTSSTSSFVAGSILVYGVK